MGADSSLAVLSDRAPSLFSYFKQLFAQVTNPAIDPVREKVVMSLQVLLGRRGNLLDEDPVDACCLLLARPVLTDPELARIRALSHPGLQTRTLDATWPRSDGARGLETALERLCAATVALSTVAPWPGMIFVSGRPSFWMASKPASIPFIVPPLARSMFG